MKRSMFGTLALAAAALLVSCADPTESLRTGAALRVTPGFLTINVNTAESVTVQLVDNQGNALPATYSASSNNPAVATVGENVNFRPGLGQNRLAGRFGVAAQALVDSTSITFTAGGQSFTVPVLVAPTSIGLTLNPAAPNVNDLVTITAPGFLFHPNAGVLFGGFAQLVTAVAADSSSITIRATNAGTGTMTMQNVALGYLPGIGSSFNSTNPETVGPGITGLTGTDALATAPDVVLPAGTTPFNLTDAGPFSGAADCANGPGFGFPCRIYRLVLTEDRSFDLSSTWDNDSDLGIYFALPDNSSAGISCDAHGNGTAGSNFEACADFSLTAGTYYMSVVSFAVAYPPPDDVDPSTITVTLTGH
jgi:hypothetical protein